MHASRLAFMSEVPEVVQKAFGCAEDSLCPEQDLLRAVVERAVLDALGYTGASSAAQHDRAVREARRWFRFDGYVQDWFDVAGVEMRPVRRAVLAVAPRSYGLDTRDACR